MFSLVARECSISLHSEKGPRDVLVNQVVKFKASKYLLDLVNPDIKICPLLSGGVSSYSLKLPILGRSTLWLSTTASCFEC